MFGRVIVDNQPETAGRAEGFLDTFFVNTHGRFVVAAFVLGFTEAAVVLAV